MSDSNTRERRENARVGFQTRIVVTTDKNEFQMDGNSKDLSLKGIFIETGETSPVGTKCRVRIFLTGMVDEIALKINGRVARQSEKGIAIAFESMDLDSYSHLKNIVRYNSSEPDDIA